jgi:hypothetical protein
MLDQRQLGAGMQLSKVYLIHERTDKEDPATCAAKEILSREGVRQTLGIESVPLVGNGKNEIVASVLEGNFDVT